MQDSIDALGTEGIATPGRARGYDVPVSVQGYRGSWTQIQKRDKIGHELMAMLFAQTQEFDVKLIDSARDILLKVTKFNAEISVATDPYFDDKEVDYDAIRPVIISLVDYMRDLLWTDPLPTPPPRESASESE